jgi:hypothetical protein
LVTTTSSVLQQCLKPNTNYRPDGDSVAVQQAANIQELQIGMEQLLGITTHIAQGIQKMEENQEAQEKVLSESDEKVTAKLDNLQQTINVVVAIAGDQVTGPMNRALNWTMATMKVLYAAIGLPSRSVMLSPNNMVFAILRCICVFFEVSILLILLEIVIKTVGLPDNTLDILVKVIFSGLTTVFVRLFQLLFTHNNPLLRLIKVGGNTVFENEAVGILLTTVKDNMAAGLSGLKSGLGIDKILEALAVIKAVPGQAMNAAASAVHTVKDTIETGMIAAGSTAFGYLKSQYQRLSLTNQANAANTAAVMLEIPLYTADTADTAGAAKRFADNLVLGIEEVDFSDLELAGMEMIVDYDYFAGGGIENLTPDRIAQMTRSLIFNNILARILIADIVKAIYILVAPETQGEKVEKVEKGGNRNRKRKGKSRKHMKRKTHRRIRNKNKKASKRRYKNKRHSKRRNRK